MTFALNSLPGKWLISVSLSIFILRFYLILLFGTNSYVSSFCLIFLGFYELCETVTSPGLEGLVLCRNIPYEDCVCQVALAGQLGLEGAQAGVRGPQDVPGCARETLAGWLELQQAWARAFLVCTMSVALAGQKIKPSLLLYHRWGKKPLFYRWKKSKVWCHKRGNTPSVCAFTNSVNKFWYPLAAFSSFPTSAAQGRCVGRVGKVRVAHFPSHPWHQGPEFFLQVSQESWSLEREAHSRTFYCQIWPLEKLALTLSKIDSGREAEGKGPIHPQL